MLDYSQWRHRSVRDLAWVIASPSLASGVFNGVEWWSTADLQEEYQCCYATLQSLDQNPQVLEAYLGASKSRALGHRFETLVAFWMKVSPRYELLKRNLQIQGDARTLGELDLIVRDRQSDAIIHLEVSVKFYMGVGALQHQMQWFGCNLNDQLGKKLEHLKYHQTQLSQRYPEKIDWPIDQRCCCVKGRLFYPSVKALQYSRENSPSSFPMQVTSDHLRGLWGDNIAEYTVQQGAE